MTTSVNKLDKAAWLLSRTKPDQTTNSVFPLRPNLEMITANNTGRREIDPYRATIFTIRYVKHIAFPKKKSSPSSVVQGEERDNPLQGEPNQFEEDGDATV